MQPDTSAADAMLRGFQEQMQAKLRQADQLQAAAREARVSERSRDGAVSVTVDSNGGMTALDLTPAAMTRRPEELSAQILDTLRRAQARIADQMREVLTPILGEDSESLNAVMGGYQERFPQLDDEDTGGSARRSDDPQDPDDPDGGSSWRNDRGW
ncbi:YbaB/EbfC family nucleoid-associated protein [Actinoalloteichus spitiensis]|uniref:YbaB/EbfC family nucleoid-associated protein n=1 Tax=Actinoalloteichus spitiensis TaxID=252394 RepID=UPI00036EBDD2|nr:YbaB/EbfC family nucleoid-associated protein [Actinoalloteichus spitiensis]